MPRIFSILAEGGKKGVGGVAGKRQIEEISIAEVPTHLESTNPTGKHYENVAKSTAHFWRISLFRII